MTAVSAMGTEIISVQDINTGKELTMGSRSLFTPILPIANSFQQSINTPFAARAAANSKATNMSTCSRSIDTQEEDERGQTKMEEEKE
uniref:Uncharacterized protein n=1 Tax=Oryza glumipatula TaxID=40148 RepID=A0A0D9Z0D2_9ORYZ